MDPALWELLRRGSERPDQEVEAIVRLDDPAVDVAGIRVVSRFGPIATCRISKDTIVRAWSDPNVVSLKAPRPLGPEREPEGAYTPALPLRAVEGDLRRPSSLDLTGLGVCVGVIDWGCDFDHPNFKRSDGSTRLLALWDQRGSRGRRAPSPYDYGTVHRRADLDNALRTARPYDALGYHPADADRDGSGAHGTACMDVAAGNGRGGGPIGVAPEADLVFVHLADRGTGGLANLGDSVRILEAVDFIARAAWPRPWVINASVGRHGGPHDGLTVAEIALGFAIGAAPNRFIVQSTGNYFDKAIHASGRLSAGSSRALTMFTHERDVTPNELEIWYSGDDEFLVSLESPTGWRSPWVRLDQQVDVIEGDGVVGRIYHRALDPNNLDNHIDLFLYPWAPAGRWIVRLQAETTRDGTFHAWLERDEVCADCQTHFCETDVDNRFTTGTLANGRLALAVGAYDAHASDRKIAEFSSAGPTRDNRPKPDLVAPGVQVLAARSAQRGNPSSPAEWVRKSGTSFAAPHVTGAVALCMQGAPRPLAGAEIRALLLESAEAAPNETFSRFGHGYLDIEKLTGSVTRRHRRDPRPSTRLEVSTTTTKPPKERLMPSDLAPAVRASVSPETIFRTAVNRGDEALPNWIDEAFVLLARPGEAPSTRPGAGDVIVRVGLGEPGLGHVAVLADPKLTPLERLDDVGVSFERDGPGLYAVVIEGGFVPHSSSDRFARRILDPSGRVPSGQVLLRPRAFAAIAEGEGDPTKPKRDVLDKGVTSRLSRFSVDVVGNEWLVRPPKDKWVDNYTSRAIAVASFAAAVQRLFGGQQPIDEFEKAHDRLVGTSIRYEAGTGEKSTLVFISQEAMESMREALGLSYANADASLRRQIRLGQYLDRALEVASSRWDELVGLLPVERLAENELTVNTVLAMLEDRRERLALVEVARRDGSMKHLVEAFTNDRSLVSGDRVAAPSDFATLSAEQWARAIVELAIATRKVIERANKLRQDELRKENLNAFLMPHEIAVENAVDFILLHLNQNAARTVGLFGIVRGGQRFSNAKNQTLFVLTVDDSQVIYQNEANGKFYRQSLPGLEQELTYGVFAQVAEKTRDIIPMTKFILGVTGALFPVAGVVVRASDVLNAAVQLQARWDELTDAYDRIRIAVINIDLRVVGLLLAVRLAVLDRLGRELLEFSVEPDWGAWFIAALKLLRRSVKSLAKGAYIGEEAANVIAKVVSSLTSALRTLLTIAPAVVKSIRVSVPAGGGGSEPGGLENAKQLVRAKLQQIGLSVDDALRFAAAITALDFDAAQLFFQEVEELIDGVEDMVRLLREATSW